jgi:hypothetical protein
LGLDDAFEYTFDPALVTLALRDPPPEMSAIPVRPTTILTPPSDGFFVFATCIFHAGIAAEGTVIRTKQCPSNLRMIAKNNLGYPDGGMPRQFMDIMPTIMRNNKTAEDILKESMLTCLSGVKSTCSAFEDAAAPESANPDQLAKMKSEVKLKCHDIEKRIKDVGVKGLTDLKKSKTQQEQLAVLFNVHEKGNALTNVVYFGTILALDESFLEKPERVIMEHLTFQKSLINYGLPKTRYMPTKRYYLNKPFDFMRPGTGYALDDFIDNLYGRLHLAVGLRLDGASYTVQLNVDLRALKASDPTTPNTITLDEVVKLLVSPTLTRRVVELVCEKHPALTLDENKEVLIRLSANADTWQVTLFDYGCSNVHVEGYPQLLYIGPEHKTTKKKKGKVVVLSAPARGSRPPRMQTIRLKNMKPYITGKKSDDVFTTLLKKRKRSDSSSNGSSSNETINPSTPKDELSSSGGSKQRRRTQRRRQCKRTRKP